MTKPRSAHKSLRSKIFMCVAVLASLTTPLVGWGAFAPPSTAVTPTMVTIGFDDGTVDQYVTAFPILSSHGMHATFFVNSGPIEAGDPGHMTWAELHALFTAGNEITGHTVEHVNVQPLSVAEAEAEVCNDRNALLDQGF